MAGFFATVCAFLGFPVEPLTHAEVLAFVGKAGA